MPASAAAASPSAGEEDRPLPLRRAGGRYGPAASFCSSRALGEIGKESERGKSVAWLRAVEIETPGTACEQFP